MRLVPAPFGSALPLLPFHELSVLTICTAPRTARAPLGNKTTNAKAKATHQTPGVKAIAPDLEKTTSKPTAARRPKRSGPQAEAPKLEVHADKASLEEEEIEYAPPKPKDLPYESDVFPDGVLTFEGLKPENLFKGYYQYYFNRVDDDGKTPMEREMEEKRQRSFERSEEQIRKDMDDFDWSVGDVPESKDFFKKKTDKTTAPRAEVSKRRAAGSATTQASTIASRKAASALARPTRASGAAQAKASRTTALATSRATSNGFAIPKKKPARSVSQPSNVTARERAAAAAASRSTLGYNKGRSASSVLNRNGHLASRQDPAEPQPRTLVRSASTASSGSDATVITARLAQSPEDPKKPDILSMFDDAHEEEDGSVGGGMPPLDDLDDDFQLTLNL